MKHTTARKNIDIVKIRSRFFRIASFSSPCLLYFGKLISTYQKKVWKTSEGNLSKYIEPRDTPRSSSW